VVTHPLRLEILERLQRDGPDSIAGLATKLERRSNALAYHVGLLEKTGVVRRSGTRRSGRRHEAVYALAATRIALAAHADPASMRAAADSANAVLRMAGREIRHALEERFCDSPRLAAPLGRRIKTWLTDRDVERVQKSLSRLERDLVKCCDEKRGRPFAMTVVLVPLGPERKSRP